MMMSSPVSKIEKAGSKLAITNGIEPILVKIFEDDELDENLGMSREEITDEFFLLLAIASLMLGAILGVMCSVNRNDIHDGLIADKERCQLQFPDAPCVRNYDAVIFIPGVICAQGCSLVMVYVMMLRLFLGIHNVGKNPEKLKKFYDKHVYGIISCYVMLSVAFVLEGFAVTNVIYVKTANDKYQMVIFYMSYVFLSLCTLGFLWIYYTYITFDSDLKIMDRFKKIKKSLAKNMQNSGTVVPINNDKESNVTTLYGSNRGLLRDDSEP